jgi:hypothetical protein
MQAPLTNRWRIRFFPIDSWLTIDSQESLQVDLTQLFINDFSLWLKAI